MFKENVAGASVGAIDGFDNMGTWALIGKQLRGLPDEAKFRIIVGY